MKKLTLGILAHVDAGKTTLTESLLLKSGVIKTAGRVDTGDAFLDTQQLEKQRGVTIVSKQAIIGLASNNALNKSGEDIKITIIDTPGHVDFVGETERALSVLDLAVIVISGPDGVTDSVKKLRAMLSQHKIPYYLFVNKMDMCERAHADIIAELRKEAGNGVIDFSDVIDGDLEPVAEEVASLSEELIERFLEDGSVTSDDVEELIYKGLLHPVLFGSALKQDGTDRLIEGITRYIPEFSYKEELSGKVFKINYEDGHKLTFLKLTGGQLVVKEKLQDDRMTDEKINQIRVYSGGKFESVNEATAGDVVTLVGPQNTYVGMGIGLELDDTEIINKPVLRYNMILPKDVPVRVFMPKLIELASEDPLLGIDTGSGDSGDSEEDASIHQKVNSDTTITVTVMGEFQLEILAATILERYNVKVSFDEGSLIYKETISDPVMGYGHFEPLRHYAEVHVLLEPLPQGRGIEIGSDVSVNDLGINWQKTVMATLSNRLPYGVLTGSQLTDMRITLVAGRAHLKHSDSRDFMQATRRAIRQGLMKTTNVLLEPFYEFRMTVPDSALGRAMNDIGQMNGVSTIESQDDGVTVLTGTAPAKHLRNYHAELVQYTSGSGRLEMKLAGYQPCSEEETIRIMDERKYDPDTDHRNLSGSVFCEHGAGYYVPWFESESLMHVPSREAEYLYGIEETESDRLEKEADKVRQAAEARNRQTSVEQRLDAIGTDEIDEILRNTTHANAGQDKRTKRVYLSKNTRVAQDRASGYNKTAAGKVHAAKSTARPKYLLVDGYNIIHAWQELKVLLGDKQTTDFDGARYRLLDIMSEYKSMKNTEIIVVFDAYKVKGHYTEKMDYMGVHVVYTKEAETADQYIARFTMMNSKNLDITVATSDGMVQLIIRGEDSRLMSARDLEEDVRASRENVMERFTIENNTKLENHIL